MKIKYLAPESDEITMNIPGVLCGSPEGDNPDIGTSNPFGRNTETIW